VLRAHAVLPDPIADERLAYSKLDRKDKLPPNQDQLDR
jgi:hypothetical protein